MLDRMQITCLFHRFLVSPLCGIYSIDFGALNSFKYSLKIILAKGFIENLNVHIRNESLIQYHVILMTGIYFAMSSLIVNNKL